MLRIANAKNHAAFGRSSSPTRRAIWPALAVLLSVIVAPSAFAQIVRIDPETPRSVTLSGAQLAEIDAFIDEYAEAAFSDDRAQAARAKDELIEPLVGEGVSVAFRQTIADRLIDLIDAGLTDQPVMLVDDDGQQSINHKPYHALRLASEIATDTTLSRIIDQLSSEDAGRRYFAIHCVETVLYRMRTNAPAVSARTLLNPRQGAASTGLLPDLGKMLAEAKSGRHAAAIVGTLAEAAELPDDVVPGAAEQSMGLIANGAAARIRAAADGKPTFENVLSWLTAGQRIVRVIAQPGATDNATSLAAVRLGGQLVAAVYRDLDTGRITAAASREGDPATKIQAQMLGIAENLLLFGEQNAAAATGRRQNAELNAAAGRIRESFVSGKDTEFSRTALSLISPNGILTAAPYGFTDDEFIVE